MNKNTFALALMLGGFSLSLSLNACFDPEDFWDEDSYSGGGHDSGDSTEDLLLVTESSEEEILLEYNTEAFAALFNWEDGNYYFSPDPDGSKTGNRIVCAAVLSAYEITGDCFRDGKVCHFEFYNDYSDIEGKDAYYLSDSSCSEGPGVGPFLVPLSSSPCGQDPFPECPSDDLFPDGYDDEGEEEEVYDGEDIEEDPLEDEEVDWELESDEIRPISSTPIPANPETEITEDREEDGNHK